MIYYLEKFRSGTLEQKEEGINMYFYSEIVDELLKEFPEISGCYAEELTWIQNTFQDQETKGQTICFDRCLCDYIGRLLVSEYQNKGMIKKVFAFLENMARSDDQEVKNLLQVTVLEYLRSWYLLQSESEKFMQPETRKMFDIVKSYLEEPVKDAIPYFHG